MIVNTEKCIGCGKCRVYCPVGAIRVENRKAVIDQDLCTECANCRRAAICPKDALEKAELTWPRVVRSQFEECNPVTSFIVDKATGKVNPEILDERVISGIIEAAVPIERLQENVEAIIAAADQLDTVFSLDVVCINNEDGTNDAKEILDRAGIWYRPNAKNNVGLGHLN